MYDPVVFLGGGNMARALVSAWIDEGYPASKIRVIDRNVSKREFYEKSLGVLTSESWSLEHAFYDRIVLSIKPQDAEVPCQMIGADIQKIRAERKENPLILSVMAGVSIDLLDTWMGGELPIVRCMPNMPAQIREGATGIYANARVDASQKRWVERGMRALGIFAWLQQEDDINAIIALSGSAPAFYFYFAEIMENCAEKMGLPKELVHAFARQTLYGAGALAKSSEKSFQTLRAEVTSKKGTTDAAIRSMQEKGLSEILEVAMLACQDRAREISRIFAAKTKQD